AENGFFAELLAGFQPVEAFHQHEPVAIPPYHDRGLLAVLQNALGDLPRLGDVERGAPFRRHIDFRNRECLALHHGGFVPLRLSCLVTSFPLPAELRFAKHPARPMRRRAFAACKADALTAPADRVAAGSARPWATCLCRPRRGPACGCRMSTTARGPSSRRLGRRCGRPSIWRSSPSDRERAD